MASIEFISICVAARTTACVGVRSACVYYVTPKILLVNIIALVLPQARECPR